MFEPLEVNPASPHADPPSPAKGDDVPSPARDTVNPPTPSKGGDDDVVITGTGHTIPGNPVALSKHTAKEEFAAMGKGKGRQIYPTMLTFLPRSFIPDS